jgi:hypothetical protein
VTGTRVECNGTNLLSNKESYQSPAGNSLGNARPCGYSQCAGKIPFARLR